MKKSLSIYVILISIIILFVSRNSCKSGMSQVNKPFEFEYSEEDTIFLKSKDVYNTSTLSDIQDTIFVVVISSDFQDTHKSKNTIFRKNIKPIEIDSTWRIKKDSAYRQLEKTEKVLKKQQFMML